MCKCRLYSTRSLKKTGQHQRQKEHTTHGTLPTLDEVMAGEEFHLVFGILFTRNSVHSIMTLLTLDEIVDFDKETLMETGATLTYTESKVFTCADDTPNDCNTEITQLNIPFQPQVVGATGTAISGIMDLTKVGFAAGVMGIEDNWNPSLQQRRAARCRPNDMQYNKRYKQVQ